MRAKKAVFYYDFCHRDFYARSWLRTKSRFDPYRLKFNPLNNRKFHLHAGIGLGLDRTHESLVESLIDREDKQ